MSSRLWLAAALLIAFGAPPARAEGVIEVKPDQAKIVELPAGVTTIVVGNPTFVDVTLMKAPHRVIVTAHGYGETNMIALDATGAILEERELRVVPPGTVLTLQNGASRVSYSCTPSCMPTVQLGDDSDAFTKTGTQITTRNGLAQGAASANPPLAGK